MGETPNAGASFNLFESGLKALTVLRQTLASLSKQGWEEDDLKRVRDIPAASYITLQASRNWASTIVIDILRSGAPHRGYTFGRCDSHMIDQMVGKGIGHGRSRIMSPDWADNPGMARNNVAVLMRTPNLTPTRVGEIYKTFRIVVRLENISVPNLTGKFTWELWSQNMLMNSANQCESPQEFAEAVYREVHYLLR